MEKLLFAIGVLLLALAIAGIALYGWHGQWSAVFFVVAVAALGKLVLGLIEIILLPLSFPAIALAKRGNNFFSFCFMAVSSVATKAAYAAFCLVILFHLLRTPGPPSWLVVALSAVLAGAPFAWAAQRTSEPPSIDTIAALFGVIGSGMLLLLGVSPLFAAAPVAVLFLVSALIHIFWWLSKGMRLIRYEAMIGRS